MRRFCGMACVSAMLLLVVCLPASAGTINSFSNESLTGNVSGTAGGSFIYNSSTNTFSSISIQFASSIGNVNANLSSMKGTIVGKNLVAFIWNTTVNGDKIWYSIILNTLTNQYQADGSISKGFRFGGFEGKYLTVPEGDATLAYLLLSALAVFGAIAISGKQRRVTRLAQSIR